MARKYLLNKHFHFEDSVRKSFAQGSVAYEQSISNVSVSSALETITLTVNEPSVNIFTGKIDAAATVGLTLTPINLATVTGESSVWTVQTNDDSLWTIKDGGL